MADSAPSEQAEAASKILREDEAAAAVVEAVDLRGARVLLVDDDQDAREVIAQLLRRAHAEVDLAGSADEAIERMSRQRPDVLISDIAMPDRDGYELIRSVRQMPEWRDSSLLPAIALTAYAREEDHLRALAAGFECHIAKPVDSVQLVAALADVLNRCRARAVNQGSRDHDQAQTDQPTPPGLPQTQQSSQQQHSRLEAAGRSLKLD
jgi:CheY-like chemotaxis protein